MPNETRASTEKVVVFPFVSIFGSEHKMTWSCNFFMKTCWKRCGVSVWSIEMNISLLWSWFWRRSHSLWGFVWTDSHFISGWSGQSIWSDNLTPTSAASLRARDNAWLFTPVVPMNPPVEIFVRVSVFAVPTSWQVIHFVSDLTKDNNRKITSSGIQIKSIEILIVIRVCRG